ncbi:MAG TPA: sensor histidine kinase [Chloroflexota bacterium]|nr:sensor histidine kinase [Chloroflexota bacterium]
MNRLSTLNPQPSTRRWEITPQELYRLRSALRRSADRHDLDATLSALASWALALVDAASIAVALRDVPGAPGPAVVRAVAGRGPRDGIGKPLDGAARRGNARRWLWLRVPIRLEGDEVGFVAARPRLGQTLDEGDAEVLKLVAAQAAMAVAQDRADVRIAVARAREEAAAAERARLARELHDETAQRLVAIGQRLDLLQMEAGAGPVGRALDQVRDMVDHALVDVRRISRDLRPAILEDLGLKAAVEALVADVARSGGAEVTLRIEGKPRPLPDRVELALFRIVQEALGNAQRHAEAGRIVVRLGWGRRDVLGEVADDGRGLDERLDAAELVKSGGLGILGMRERAEEVGGRFEIESSRGSGTVVRARVPLTGGTIRPDVRRRRR